LQIKEKGIEKKDKSMLLSAFLSAGKSFFVEAVEVKKPAVTVQKPLKNKDKCN
jgi:hypothetical protein